MRLPFKGLYIFTQDFGANPENYAQYLVLYPDGVERPMKGHNGLDFGTPTRTEIVAPHDGTIIEATFDETGYGWYVKIENEEEGSVIAHLDSIDVKVEYQLLEGDHIGWSDNTGNSTGPHCHWGYYKFPRDRSNGIAGFIDQKPYLETAGIHLTLGQLPVIDTVSANSATLTGEYKGLDLSDSDSVKAAIDAWYDVAHGKYKTAEEYQALEVQLSTVKLQLEDTQKASETVSSDLKNYNEMRALGYNTVDDIANILKKKDDTNLALQTENTQIRKRNGTLADMVREIEEEDHAAAEMGLKAVEENKRLKEFFQTVGKVVDVKKMTTENIISGITHLKDLADRFLQTIEKAEQDRVRKMKIEQTVQAIKSVPSESVTRLFQLLHLNQAEREVN